SSSANMVAGITDTKIYDNVKIMFKTAVLPFVIAAAAYTVLSVMNPISHVDQDMVTSFENEFAISFWSFIPAVLMIALPLFKVGVLKAMTASIISGILVACLVQGTPVTDVMHICVMGYQSESEGLGTILNGGGLVSMLE